MLHVISGQHNDMTHGGLCHQIIPGKSGISRRGVVVPVPQRAAEVLWFHCGFCDDGVLWTQKLQIILEASCMGVGSNARSGAPRIWTHVQ